MSTGIAATPKDRVAVHKRDRGMGRKTVPPEKVAGQMKPRVSAPNDRGTGTRVIPSAVR